MCFGRKKVEPEKIQPTSTVRISYEDLFSLIKRKYPDSFLYLSDKEYLLCDYDDIALFLAQDESNKETYVENEYDCDDFSYRLMGQFSIPGWSSLCFGIVWTMTHSMNCFIDVTGKFWFIEPQTDELMKTTDTGNVRLIVI